MKKYSDEVGYSKDYSVLPRQKPWVVDVGACGKSVREEGDGVYTTQWPLVTNRWIMTFSRGEPGAGLDWHTHMPSGEQFHYCISGEATWYYKDNDGEEQTVTAGPHQAVYLPGGLENRFEVVGDEEDHTHVSFIPKLPIIRVEQLLGESGGKYNPREYSRRGPAALRYDNDRDEVVHKDDDAILF